MSRPSTAIAAKRITKSGSLKSASALRVFKRAALEPAPQEVLLPDVNAQLRGKWIDRHGIGKLFDNAFKLPVSTVAFDIWGRDINATVADKEMAERLLKVGAEPLTMSMEDLLALVRSELETNSALIKTKGFRPE